MADRFFTDQPLAPGEITLDGPEAHHLSAVRRFAPGEAVTLFNGDGAEYPAEVLAVYKKSVSLVVIDRREVNRERPWPLVVASAIPKADRADFLLEKLTELGATAWIPLICERSVVVPREAKREKLQRAVIEASKQCGRNTLMLVEPPRSIAELIRSTTTEERYFLHPGEASQERVAPTRPRIAAIGPEGGFSPAEVQALHQAGWQPLTLGPRILRIETAAIAACLVL